MPGILIIGYGNLLREDDGIGCRTARALKRHFRDCPEVRVLEAPQLAPEMAEDISCSEFVLFLDAKCGEPGTIRRARVEPHPGPSGFTHQLTPASLLAAAEQLYGRVPIADSLTLTGWSFRISDRLSRNAEQSMPQFIQHAVDAVEEQRVSVTK